MAQKLDPRRELATFQELVLSPMYEQEATRPILVQKGLLSEAVLLEEINVMRRELEAKWRR